MKKKILASFLALTIVVSAGVVVSANYADFDAQTWYIGGPGAPAPTPQVPPPCTGGGGDFPTLN